MKNDDDARGGIRPHLDAKQCELLIGLACNAGKPAIRPAAPAQETTVSCSQRDSLAEAMIGLILGPDAF
jgi:hypothetical protein